MYLFGEKSSFSERLTVKTAPVFARNLMSSQIDQPRAYFKSKRTISSTACGCGLPPATGSDPGLISSTRGGATGLRFVFVRNWRTGQTATCCDENIPELWKLVDAGLSQEVSHGVTLDFWNLEHRFFAVIGCSFYLPGNEWLTYSS